MGKMFSNLQSESLEQSEDRLGGGFEAIPTGAYDAVIKLMYAGQSQGGAHNITVVAELADGKEFRETVYITNKQGENWYPDKADKTKKMPLPGFTTIDDICLLTTGESLTEQETEEKTVKIYNYEKKTDIPTPVQCITACHGKPVKLGILREIVDKQKKNSDSGAYENTGETRTQNTIDKVFHAESGRTVNEFRNEIEAPEFLNAWSAKNDGKDRNKATGVTGGGGAGASGSGRPGAGAPKAKTSLFGAK